MTVYDNDIRPTLYVRRIAATGNDVDLWWVTAPTDATTLTVPS